MTSATPTPGNSSIQVEITDASEFHCFRLLLNPQGHAPDCERGTEPNQPCTCAAQGAGVRHAGYPDRFRCGCVCAGHMEQDYAAAEDRERRAHNRAARRAKWLSRQWSVSDKGNSFLNARGFNIVVYFKAGAWHARITHRETGRGFWSRRTYSTPDACKLATFDALVFIEEHESELL
jgi:hypothetical protein